VVSRSFTRSHSTSTSTTKGFSIGGKFAYTSKGSANILFARAESSVGVEVNGTYTFSKNENETEGTSESTTVSISTPAEAGYTTRLDVYSTKRDARYNYEANLLFGKVNGAEHVNTPAPLGLDQSPARSQPCLPLIVGSGSSHNSMQNIAVSILNSGVSPVDLPPDRRETLNGIGNFGTPGGLCPGFPNQFAAQASFHGTGVANYADMATGADGTPATDYEACVYRAPFGSSAPTYVRPVTARLARVLTRRSTAAPTAGDSPCRVVPNNSIVRGEAPGVQIDDRSLTGSDGSRPTIAGPNRSDEISGSDAPRETIYTGTGAFDIVHGGDGAGDRIVGGAGDNLIHGGSGNGDRLIAGSGGNELDAGNGRGDVLQDTAGGHAVLTGGSGDDTVITDRSLKVPLYVENAIATGAQAVTCAGTPPPAGSSPTGAMTHWSRAPAPRCCAAAPGATRSCSPTRTRTSRLVARASPTTCSPARHSCSSGRPRSPIPQIGPRT
jgi:Clostridium epsilon toxin ETX/Bacillus mosquitocidal toxin MTX2